MRIACPTRDALSPAGNPRTALVYWDGFDLLCGVHGRPEMGLSDGLKGNDHGVDDPDPRRDLHRPRDQRLPAGRVLIAKALRRGPA